MRARGLCGGRAFLREKKRMKTRYPIEVGIFVGLLVLLNLPIEGWRENLVLLPEAVRAGEVWRLAMFAWAHVSLYHLLLDASAFIFLYQSLRCSAPRRLLHLGVGILMSGLLPIALDPRIESIGLCGMSGVAHGLMLICGLEAASQADKKSKWLGLALFAAGLGKTILEQVTGNVLFANQHLGNVGTPIAACHFGGAVGALLSFGATHYFSARARNSLGDIFSLSRKTLLR